MKLTHQSALKITKPGRYFDHASSMHLWVKSPHQKYWILRYMSSGKRQDMSLGSINVVPLQEARKKALDAQIELSKGINPLAKKKATKEAIVNKKAPVLFSDFALLIYLIAILKCAFTCKFLLQRTVNRKDSPMLMTALGT